MEDIRNNIKIARHTTMCTICQETIFVKQHIYKTKCSHVYHTHCIMFHVLNSNIKCPLCRQDIS
jgi:hypothetical protein